MHGGSPNLDADRNSPANPAPAGQAAQRAFESIEPRIAFCPYRAVLLLDATGLENRIGKASIYWLYTKLLRRRVHA